MTVEGAGALVAVVLHLPEAPQDFLGEWERFNVVEEHALATLRQEVTKVDRGDITEEQFADFIETKIIPPWSAARERLGTMGNRPPIYDLIVPKVTKYMKLREEG